MARIETVNGERLMTAAEVGGLYRVGIWAVDRWAADGKLHSLTGPDGELRFYAGQVHALLRGEAWELPRGGDETAAR